MADEVKDKAETVLPPATPLVEKEAVAAPVATPPAPAVDQPAPVAAPVAAADLPKRKPGRPRKAVAEPGASLALPASVPPVAKAAVRRAIKAGKAKPAVEKAPVVKAGVKLKATKPVPVAMPAATVRRQPASPAPRVSQPPRVPFAATAARAASAPAPMKEFFKMDTTATEFTDKLQSAMKDATERARAAFEKSQAAFGDVGEFTKGNVEAVVESTKILATGLQEMGKSYVAESKSVMEAATAEIKELAAVKSPTEFFEKQAALLRKQFDAAVAASSKNSEAMLKLASDAFQPISTRVSLTVEKIKQAA